MLALVTPPVPITVIVYVPAGVLAPVVMSSVLDAPEATLDGVNVADAPVGSPVAERATV